MIIVFYVDLMNSKQLVKEKNVQWNKLTFPFPCKRDL